MPLGLLGGIISGVGSYAGAKLGYKGQKESNQTNLQLAEQARQHDISMWNQQNAYNTPAMQMQRMKEAGLNTNLIYGSGAGQNYASPPPKAPVPKVDNELASFAQMSLAPTISLYQDWQVKKAQINNIEADTNAKKISTALNQFKVLQEQYRRPYYELRAGQEHLQRESNWQKTHSQALSADLREKYDIKAYPALLNQIYLRNEVLKASAEGQQLENQLSGSLKPYGLTARDNVWARIFMSIAKNNPKLSHLLNYLK